MGVVQTATLLVMAVVAALLLIVYVAKILISCTLQQLDLVLLHARPNITKMLRLTSVELVMRSAINATGLLRMIAPIVRLGILL